MMVSALLEREQGGALPIRNGAFVAVVGPSGAGKDTLLAYAKAALADEPQVEFVRRCITRPCDGETEEHDTLTDAAFAGAQAEGHVAVANVSRGALPALRQRYANVAVVEVTADPEILAARLAGRGRESHGEILARLQRTVACDTTGPNTIALDNGGPKEVAGDKLIAILRKAMAFADISGTV